MQLPFADFHHSDSSSDSEYDPATDLFSVFSRHTLLVEVTRPRPIDNPEPMREKMEAVVRNLDGVEGWTALIPSRLVGSYWEESVGLPVPGKKLLENRAVARGKSGDKDVCRENDDAELPASISTPESETTSNSRAKGRISHLDPVDESQPGVTFTFEIKGLSIVIGIMLGRLLARWGENQMGDCILSWYSNACVVYESDGECEGRVSEP